MVIVEKNGRILAFKKGVLRIEGDKVFAGNKPLYSPVSRISAHEVPDQDLSHLKNEDGTISGIWPTDVDTQFVKPFLDVNSIYYAKVAGIDASRTDKKYIQVTRTIEGQGLTAWCYVTYSMLQAYQAGDLAIDDYVIIGFVDNDLDKPIAMNKVIGF